MVIEREKSFLLKYFPEQVLNGSAKKIVDLYIPENAEHTILRLRKKGDKYEMTKKYYPNPLKPEEAVEYTIPLSYEEYNALSYIPAKKIAKKRYSFEYNGYAVVVDVFVDNLAGLAMAEIEYTEVSLHIDAPLPDFFLAPVKEDAHLAGGMLAGKQFSELNAVLAVYNYKPLYI